MILEKNSVVPHGVNHGTRKQIKTVRLERQPHKDALHRLRMAYQQLLAAPNH